MRKLRLSATILAALAVCLAWMAAPPGAALAQAPCNAAASQYDPNPNNNCDSATTVVFDPDQSPRGAAGAYPGAPFFGFPFVVGLPSGVSDANASVSPDIASTGASSETASTGGALAAEAAITAPSAPSSASSSTAAANPANAEAPATTVSRQTTLPNTGGSAIFLIAGGLTAAGMLMRAAIRTR